MESIREILYGTVLSNAYSRQDLPRRYFFAEDVWPSTIGQENQVEGNVYDLIFEREQTEPVPVNDPEGTANVLDPYGLTLRRASLLYTSNGITLHTDALQALREPNSMALQNKGRWEIARQIRNLRIRHMVYKELAMACIFCNGVIYVNGQRKILPYSGGAAPAGAVGSALTWGIPASNQGNCGGIVDVMWDQAGADIQKQLDSFDATAEQNQIEKPTEVIINAWNKNWLRNNTLVQLWAAKNGFGDAATLLRGNMIEGMFGKNWHFVGGYWTAPDGTKQPYVPFNRAVLCPPFNDPWVVYKTGSCDVPRSIDVTPSIDNIDTLWDTVYGDFAYAKLQDDPVRVVMIAGMKWGVDFADPNALWQPTVFTGHP